MARLTSGSEQRQETLRRAVDSAVGELRTDATTNARALAADVSERFRMLADGLANAVQRAAEVQRERLDGFARTIAESSQAVEARQEALHRAIEARLDALESESAKKLDHLRLAVEGEVQSARDMRLFDSIKHASEALDLAHKAVGEMQSIAAGANLRILPRSLESPR
jgi:DNA recombination protein RmuC